MGGTGTEGAAPAPRPDGPGKESSDATGESRGVPDLSRITDRIDGPLGALAVAGTGLLVLGVFYTLYTARAFVLPVVLAILLKYLLNPVVRALGRVHVAPPLAAGVVVLGFLAVTGTGIYHLSEPAATWVQRAPETMRRAEYRLRDIRRPVERVQQAAEEVEEATDMDGEDGGAADREVRVEQATLSESLLGSTWELLAGGCVVLFLLYFLLASGDTFLRKVTGVLPRWSDRRRVVEITRSLETDLSRYLGTMAMINTGMGAIIACVLYLLEVPAPLLWGVVAAALNFIPYLGPVVGIGIVALVSLVTFDQTWSILAPPAAYALVNMIEGSLVTPFVMGRRLRLNPAVVFLWLFFWGWLWGIPGALLAVPLLATFKIVCENVPVLAPFAAFVSR